MTGSSSDNDASNGWEAVAGQWLERRQQSSIGVDVMRTWAGTLNGGSSILDLGCGSGVPVAQALMQAGFIVSGIDASPTLIAAFRSRFPRMMSACEPVETSRFLGRSYDAVIAIGLIFLLSEAAQTALLLKVGATLKVGGRFLVTAPVQACAWNDLMTGRESRSLGAAAYQPILAHAGLTLAAEYTDEGQNHYYDTVRDGQLTLPE
jgi:2-polyprenyl-3-methyl-5-hydroxy-6-metoxy-1,4-benzoquinol methylase